MPVSVRQSGSLRNILGIYVRDSGVLRDIKKAYVRVNGTLHDIFTKVLLSTTSTFASVTANTTYTEVLPWTEYADADGTTRYIRIRHRGAGTPRVQIRIGNAPGVTTAVADSAALFQQILFTDADNDTLTLTRAANSSTYEATTNIEGQSTRVRVYEYNSSAVSNLNTVSGTDTSIVIT